MENLVLISVIIPNYNRSELLKIAIESVLSQTYQPIEILVCDDGSTDNSKEIVFGFAPSLVKWIDCGKNGRPAIPRNIGIRAAKGNWIAFLDNDDVWLPHKLERQVHYISINENSNAVCSNAFRLRANNTNEIYFKDAPDCLYSFEQLFYSNPIICSSVLLKKSVLDDFSFFPEGKEYKAIEDYALWLKLSTKIKFNYISEPLLYYRDELVSDSIRKRFNSIEEIRTVIFPELAEWIKTKKIKLSSRSELDLKYQLCLIKNEFRLSDLKKYVFRILYKLNDFRLKV